MLFAEGRRHVGRVGREQRAAGSLPNCGINNTPAPADTPTHAHAQTARVPECTQHDVLLYQTIMIPILYAYVILSNLGQTMHLLRAPLGNINNML